MAWNAPSTVTVGQVLTAAFWNAQVRDNENMLRGLFARKTADESVTSSTVLQNDDHLVLAVEANTVYEFEMLLSLFGATAGDFKFQFAVPAAATIFGSWVGYDTALVSANLLFVNAVTSIGVSNVLNLPLMVKGIARVGATAGNMQLQWAQDVSNGTATIVRADSYLKTRAVA